MTKRLSDTPAARRARERRVERGRSAEAEARARTPKASLQSMLAFPLLAALDRAGGAARPRDVYEDVADRLEVPEEVRRETRSCADGRVYNRFQQQVRWTRQTLKMQGLIVDGGRGKWELADPAYKKLGRVRRGTAVLVYSTDLGVALWAHAEDAAAHIEPGSVNLVFTSPVYPIGKARAYGGMDVPAWLDWMGRLTRLWRELIADDGWLVVNLGDVYVSGAPVLSPYIERFTLHCLDEVGLHLAGRHYWHSPNKMPSPIPWVAKQRVRVKASVEHILMFSRSANPKADNRRVLEPYSPASFDWWARCKKQARVRPSGYDIHDEAFAPTGAGAIPGNLIVAAGVGGGDAYSRRCRAAGLPAHPARFPEALPERVILLCTDEGDTVYDPMAGSNMTGAVAERLGRRWISSEPMQAYVRGSALRFDAAVGFRRYDVPEVA
jgi:DNA modification methylase